MRFAIATFLLWRAAIVLPVACFAVGDAAAVGLGPMTVVSRLGARFEAEVPLFESSGDRATAASCFHLGQGGNGDIPVLTKARLTVEQRGTGLRLRIVSDQTINDPVLQVSVHAGCGAEVVRQYVVLVDPPIAVRLPGTGGRPAMVPRTSREATASRWPGQPGRRLPEADAALAGATGPSGPARGGPPDLRSAEAPSRPGKPSSRRPSLVTGPTDRLLLSIEPSPETLADGEVPELRLSSRLSVHLLSGTSESRRALLRIEYKLLSAIQTQAEQQLAVAEHVRRLATAVAGLQQRAEGHARLVETERAAAPTAAPASGPESARIPSEKAGAVSERAGPAARTFQAEEGDWWVEAGLLVALVGGLAWWLRRRAMGRSSDEAVTAPAGPPTLPVPDSVWELDTGSALSDREAGGWPAGKAPAREEQAGGGGVDPGGQVPDDPAAVVDLAEIMLSFGRVKAAEKALAEFIEKKPAAAVEPWLKLLEIYRQRGDRGAFDALAIRLTRRFNVAPVDWDTTQLAASPALAAGDLRALPIDGVLARLPAIGRLSHVRHEIARTWGSPDCLAYLERLLRDNRHGERTGFSLRIVHEILFLADLLRSRLPPGE